MRGAHMAQFKLTSFIDIGTKGYHTATSWRVTKDRQGNQIIDESLNDTVNLTHWISPLPDGKGGFYSDLNEVHLWVKVHILNDESYWRYSGMMNQNDQTFIITDRTKTPITVATLNSITAGIH
jgi:hypothetical protein